MAEAVGAAASLVSLASPFSTCIECFGYYRAVKERPRQVKTQLVKLDFEETVHQKFSSSDLLLHVLQNLLIIQTAVICLRKPRITPGTRRREYHMQGQVYHKGNREAKENVQPNQIIPTRILLRTTHCAHKAWE